MIGRARKSTPVRSAASRRSRSTPSSSTEFRGRLPGRSARRHSEGVPRGGHACSFRPAQQARHVKQVGRADTDCPHFHGPTSEESYMKKAPQGRCGTGAVSGESESVGRMQAIQVPSAKPEYSANKDCPQAFRADRATENAEQRTPPKTGTPENNPPKSYKPSSDADESDPRIVARMLTNPNRILTGK